MSTLINDIKYGIRQLIKSPGFTIVAVLTLAIGISANITMFSVVNTVLLRPLPFKQAERLTTVGVLHKRFNMASGLSYPAFQEFRKQNQVFGDLAAYTRAHFDVNEAQGAYKVEGAQVSGNFFSMLDVPAVLGRTFTPGDEQVNSEPVAVVSYDFWQKQLGQAQDVIGRTITLHDTVYTVVGVLPPGFQYPESIGETQVWTVLNPTDDRRTNRNDSWLCVVGPLKPDVTLTQALPLMNELHLRNGGHPDSEIRMSNLRDSVISKVQTTLWILAAIVGFTLLIVCANVANLCLVRATSRDKEIAVRQALGANTLRLLRQLTTESTVLALLGGVMGLVITIWTISWFRVRIADFVPMANSIRIEPRILLFSLGLSLLVGMVLGVTPFWFIQRPRLVNVLTERRSTSGRHAGFSNMLIAGQIAMALILSIGMGLMIRSMKRLSSAETGFNQHNLVTLKLDLDQRDDPQRQRFSSDFLDRLRALPFVTGVATDSSMPCSQMANIGPVYVEGYTLPDDKPMMVISHNVSPDYFRTLQMPIQRGRAILPEEHQRKDKVVIVSESLAQRIWPGQDPIDRELTFVGQQYRIVGTVADVIQGNVKGDRPDHAFFPFDATFHGSELNVVVRATTDPGQIVSQARAILADTDATIPLYDVSTFIAQMNRCISRERFTAAFLTIFASIALLLIAVGIYGVVSYAITQRTREIGIRMALGAQKASILTMVLKHGLVLLAIGSAIGIAGAIGLTRFLSSYLYGVNTLDTVTFILIPLLVATVSLLACYFPARRAAKIDPMEALRYE